jgi:hypothetical protein
MYFSLPEAALSLNHHFDRVKMPFQKVANMSNKYAFSEPQVLILATSF